MIDRRNCAAYMEAMITPIQSRAARTMIGWTQEDLASATGLSAMSIKNFERGITDPRSSTIIAIQNAFAAAGVIFLEPGDTRDGGQGLRFR